ncbi:hypothetical protein NPIL_235981 [Nephila pilipes]|uniref:Uncharacterized protein n=1 Tax=Nephila pilipes TaxID=299642 RepID=A0A8X6U465_NEPPI|nr:hypothetical protein NPIL_235981 [Nephila pilipes]
MQNISLAIYVVQQNFANGERFEMKFETVINMRRENENIEFNKFAKFVSKRLVTLTRPSFVGNNSNFQSHETYNLFLVYNSTLIEFSDASNHFCYAEWNAEIENGKSSANGDLFFLNYTSEFSNHIN